MKTQNKTKTKTSEEGAIEPQIVSKMEETREPTQILSLNFEMVERNRYRGRV